VNDRALLAAAEHLLGDESVDEELITAAVEGGLAFQRCIECGYLRLPPAAVCPECLHGKSEWVRDSGLGTVWSFCIYHRAFDPAFKDALPYNVALIELDSGPLMISNVLAVEAAELKIGLRVVALTKEVRRDRRLVYFEPTKLKEGE
jgi:uncharacterized OB-fold protein